MRSSIQKAAATGPLSDSRRVNPRLLSVRSSALALWLLCAMFAACGGSDDAAPAPAPATPFSQVSAFPPSSGAPYYNGSDIDGLVSISVETLSDGTQQITNIDQIRSLGNPRPLGVTLQYLGPTNYELEFGGFGGPSFRPQDFRGSTSLFDHFRAVRSGYTENLELARKSIGVDLIYSTFGIFSFIAPPPGSSSISLFSVGSVTPSSQMPTAGSATLVGIVDGFWVDGSTTRRLFGSAARAEVNFAAGTVTSLTLDLSGLSNPFGDFTNAPKTLLGAFTGSGKTRGGLSNAIYEGSIDATAGYAGSFAGNFFGPSANEFAIAFKLTAAAQQSVIGVAVFRRTN